MKDATNCPLCHSRQITPYHSDKRRRYLHCGNCDLVFVEKHFLPSLEREKQEYSLHQNDPTDQGYRKFLSRLSTPLLTKLSAGQKGLDFGCGPGPALSLMFEEAGHTMSVYDPLFYPETDLLSHTYDFITCTEAIEHFHKPAGEWASWMNMLKPGGWLAIMTKMVIDQERFSQWHYKNDQTHVSFFSKATFNWLANRDQLTAEFFSNDVVLLQKKS